MSAAAGADVQLARTIQGFNSVYGTLRQARGNVSWFLTFDRFGVSPAG